MLQIRQHSITLLILALLMMTSTAQATDIRDTVKKSFKVRPGGTLYMDIDHGNLEVTTVRSEAVLVEVERIVEEDDAEAREILERHHLSMEQRGNDVSIDSRIGDRDGLWDRIRSHGQIRVRVYVSVPERYNVDFKTGAGNVSIADLVGRVEGQTGAGNVDIGDIAGTVDVSTGSGNISIHAADGRLEANTGAGNIEVREVRGDVDVTTGAGNITARIVEQPEHESKLRSGAGNVTVFLRDHISVDVDGEASVGSASTDFPLEVEGKWMRKTFHGALNGGGPDLRLRTGVGNVSLKRL